MIPECACCGRYRRTCRACRSCGRQTCRADRDRQGDCLGCSTDPTLDLLARYEPALVQIVEIPREPSFAA